MKIGHFYIQSHSEQILLITTKGCCRIRRSRKEYFFIA